MENGEWRMELVCFRLSKRTGSGLNVIKTKQCSKNVNIRISRSKGLSKDHKSAKIPKTKFCCLYLIHDYLEHQGDLH